MRGFKYYFLQTKRFFSAVLYVLLLSMALIGCLSVGVAQTAKDKEASEQRYELGIVGDASDAYLKLGFAALQNLDDSRFAIHLQFLDEATAADLLERGLLNAYVVIPNGFIDDALHGDVNKLSFVTRPTAAGAVDYVKDELLSVISTVLVESQKGAYAAAEVGRDYADLGYGKTATAATLSYVDLILSRGKLYRVETLGIVGGLPLMPSVLCGVMLFFSMLISIGFAPVFSKNDTSYHRLLSASRFGSAKQIICEYAAFLSACLTSAALLLSVVFGLGGAFISRLTECTFPPSFFAVFAFALCVFASLQFFLYEWTQGITAGVLAQFLCAAAMCYFSGCFYPVYFFPEAVQHIAPYLPTGAAHALLAGTLTGQSAPVSVVVLTIYLLVFLLGAILLRRRKQTERGGDLL